MKWASTCGYEPLATVRHLIGSQYRCSDQRDDPMTGPRKVVTRQEAVHQQVARHIRNDIAAGVLRDGERLPSTRELADEWGVSVFTINEAMNVLIGEGLVTSKPRAGRVVHAPDQRAPERTLYRAERPSVVYVGGYAGSGKTLLGRMLAKETGWPMFDKDTLTRPVVEAALRLLGGSPHDRESDTYLTHVRAQEYAALAAATQENVECGNSAIVTAPFLREFADPAWLSRTQASCAEMGADPTFVWVECDAESMHQYLEHRGAARDTGKLADWDGYLAKIDLDFRPPVPHLVVSNSVSSEPLQEQAPRLLAAVLNTERN